MSQKNVQNSCVSSYQQKLLNKMQAKLFDKLICSQKGFVEMQESTALSDGSNSFIQAMNMEMDI